MKTPSPRFPADPAAAEQAALWAARLDGGTLDAAGVEKRRVSRSKYGVKRPKAGAAAKKK